MPIVFVVIISGAKDAFEDWKRHTNDKNLNKTIAFTLKGWNNVMAVEARRSFFLTILYGVLYPLIYIGKLIKSREKLQPIPLKHDTARGLTREIASDDYLGQWTGTFWENLRVGDFLLLRNNDPVPADCIILASSSPEGVCYVETKNLDGETNLKMRRALQLGATGNTNALDACLHKVFRVESEYPHPNMYLYRGLLTAFDINPRSPPQDIDKATVGSTHPLTIDNVLLRGCVVRNTPLAICLAVATGKETKIMLNSGATPSKQSFIERQMNPQVTDAALG
jgi:phospholipid-translocating ATPase